MESTKGSIPFSSSEIEELRAATPGCSHRIHLNNAGAALMTETVLAAQVDHLRLEAEIGGYEAAGLRAEAIAQTHGAIGNLIGAEARNMAVVENATVGWNQAFHSLRLGDGDQVITSEADYGANFVTYLQAARLTGVEIVVAPNDETGAVDPDALINLIDERTKLISISHTPTNGGLVNPAEAIGAVAREAGITYLLDACQTVGQLDLDVKAIGCDFLSATARKYIRGPRGSGLLYVSDAALEWAEPAMLDHHGADWSKPDDYTIRPDAKRFENWEFNYATVLGFALAAKEATGLGLDRIEVTVTALAQQLRDRLHQAEFPTYDLGSRKCGLVTTVVDGVEAASVQTQLRQRGINTSTSTRSSTLIDSTRRDLPDLLRLSVHYYNTVEELEAVVAALIDIRS